MKEDVASIGMFVLCRSYGRAVNGKLRSGTMKRCVFYTPVFADQILKVGGEPCLPT